ncbi:MAG: cation:proton antiporter [Clostridia bacterium]
MISEIILGLSIILFTGLLFGKLSKVLHLPNVTLYLLGGCLIGPAILKLLFPSYEGVISETLVESLKIFTTIELGFIAFGIGSEFKISYFKEVGKSAVIIAFLESLTAVIFITVGLLLFNFPLYFALSMGAVGGATAPAATIMVIKQYKSQGELTRTTLSVVAIDDASTLIYFGVCMAIVKSLVLPSSGNIALTILMPFLEIIASLVLGLIMGVFVSLGSKWFTGRGNRTSFIVACIFLVIGLEILLKKTFNFGLSSLLSCMTMSAIFTNISSKTCEEVVPLIDRITPPLVVIFFVISGADLKVEAMSIVALIVLAIYLVFRIVGKISGTWVGGKISHAKPIVQKYLGYGLLPQGGIAIGLSLAVMSILDPQIAQLSTYMGIRLDGMLLRVVVLFAVFVSEFFGPICLKWALFKSGEAQQPPKKAKKSKPILIATADSSQVIMEDADSNTENNSSEV